MPIHSANPFSHLITSYLPNCSQSVTPSPGLDAPALAQAQSRLQLLALARLSAVLKLLHVTGQLAHLRCFGRMRA